MLQAEAARLAGIPAWSPHIVADLQGDAGPPVTAHFDWCVTGAETCQATSDTHAGPAILPEGGARFTAPGMEPAGEDHL